MKMPYGKSGAGKGSQPSTNTKPLVNGAAISKDSGGKHGTCKENVKK